MNKTTLAEKIGYSIASLGDATAYSLIGVFLIFFLTTIAGIPPGIAGTIAAVGSIWNAVVNPLIGYFADKVRTRFGRRRPVIFVFSIPLLLSMALLFTNVAIPMAVKPFYYGALVMLYWVSYTGFIVPYLALGAEYTADYDDRTALRLWSSFFNMFGSALAMVSPTIIVDFLESLGMSQSGAWSLTAVILGLITFASILVTVAAARHKDVAVSPQEKSGAKAQGAGDSFVPQEIIAKAGADAVSIASQADVGKAQAEGAFGVSQADAGTKTEDASPQADFVKEGAEDAPPQKETFRFKQEVSNIFKEYISVAKLKPMKSLVASSSFALIAHTLLMSNLVYVLTYNLGLSATEVSGSMLLRVLFSTALIPVVAKMIAAIDRRGALIGFYVFGCIGMCFIRFADLPQMAELLVYLFFSVICTSTYWQIIPGTFYDVCEYDRIKNGRHRSATILSFQGLVEAMSAGIGGQLLGLILEAGGFDGEAAVQSARAQFWIENTGTVIPVVFLLLSAAALYKYPLDRKTYNELLESERR